MAEIDFKAGNVGVDKNLNTVKIDGGLCFATIKKNYIHLFKGKSMDITTKDLETLPILSKHSNYKPCNWLDYIQWNSLLKSPFFNTNSRLKKFPANSLIFRKEINETILRILLLPNKLIYIFTQSYIPETTLANSLAKLIIERKKQLKNAANKNRSFLDYKSSNQAQRDTLKYLQYLKSFKTIGKASLLTTFKEQWNYNAEERICENFIKGYLPIKEFFLKLNAAHLLEIRNLNSSYSSLSSNNFTNSIQLIQKLKQSIDDYFKVPNRTQLKTLFKTVLSLKIELLKNADIPQNSILIKLISTFQFQLRPFIIKIPIFPVRSTPKIAKNTQCTLLHLKTEHRSTTPTIETKIYSSSKNSAYRV